MNKIEFLSKLLDSLKNEIVISPLGETSQEWFSIKDRPENFYMLGSMGLPVPFALGIALSIKENVYVIEGDGSILMNLGSLTTVGSQNPDNLKIIILDNGSYNTTGGQPSATSINTKLDEISKGAGIESMILDKASKLNNALLWLNEKGCKTLVVNITPYSYKSPLISLSPKLITRRIKNSIKHKSVRKTL